MLGVVLGWALKWSSVAHSHRRDPRVNRSSPMLTKRKRGMKGKAATGCDNKDDHGAVLWWPSGWKPMSYQIRLGQMLRRYLRKPLLHLCSSSTIRCWNVKISYLFLNVLKSLLFFLPSFNSRSEFRVSYRFRFIPKDTPVDTWIDTQLKLIFMC